MVNISTFETGDPLSEFSEGLSNFTQAIKKSTSAFFRKPLNYSRGEDHVIQDEDEDMNGAGQVVVAGKAVTITLVKKADYPPLPHGVEISNITRPTDPRARPLEPRSEELDGDVLFRPLPEQLMWEGIRHNIRHGINNPATYNSTWDVPTPRQLSPPASLHESLKLGPDEHQLGNEIQLTDDSHFTDENQSDDETESRLSSDFRSTPILQRDSLINGFDYRKPWVSPTHHPIKRDLRPAPLKFSQRSRGLVLQELQYGQPTPPSSSESNQQQTSFTEFGERKLISNTPNSNGYILMSSNTPDPIDDEEDIPDERSIYQRIEKHEPTVNSFFNLGDDDCLEQLEEDIRSDNASLDQSQWETTHYGSSSSQYEAPSLPSRPASPTGDHIAQRFYNQAPSIASSALRTISSKGTTKHSFPEWLAQRLADKAQEFGFDMMYVVEIKSLPGKVGEREPNLAIKLVTAYNLDQRFTPNLQLHLEALRQRVPYVHETEHDHSSENRFKYGIMTVVAAEGGIIAKRNNGFILGAFRIKNNRSKTADAARLKTFIHEIKPRFQVPSSPTDMLILKRQMTNPTGDFTTNMEFRLPTRSLIDPVLTLETRGKVSSHVTSTSTSNGRSRLPQRNGSFDSRSFREVSNLMNSAMYTSNEQFKVGSRDLRSYSSAQNSKPIRC